MISEEKYIELQDSFIKINKRIDAARKGSKVSFAVTAEKSMNKKSYYLVFNFQVSGNKIGEEQRKYAIMIINSLIYKLHFIRSCVYTNNNHVFEVKIRPDWGYYHDELIPIKS
jgi:hypothetical protein